MSDTANTNHAPADTVTAPAPEPLRAAHTPNFPALLGELGARCWSPPTRPASS